MEEWSKKEVEALNALIDSPDYKIGAITSLNGAISCLAVADSPIIVKTDEISIMQKYFEAPLFGICAETRNNHTVLELFFEGK